MIRLKDLLNEVALPNGIDTDTLKSDTDKKKFVELGYISEYPDVTIIYINSTYSKTSNYILEKSNKMTSAYIKDMDRQFRKEYGIRIYLHELGMSDSITAKIMAQPDKYKAI